MNSIQSSGATAPHATSFARIGAAAAAIGLSTETLRRYEQAGRLESVSYRSVGGHRVFDLAKLKELLGIPNGAEQHRESGSTGKVIALVSRASSAKQADTSIPEQKRDLEEYAKQHFPGVPFKHYVRTASGLNFDAIMPLVDDVVAGKISRVVACNFDRLLRLGNKLLIQVFSLYGCEVTFINDSESTDTIELDLLALVQWYCNSYSGKRFAQKYGIQPTAEQIELIHSCFSQSVGLRKTYKILKARNLLTDARGRKLTESFLYRYYAKNKRLFRKLTQTNVDPSCANSSPTVDPMLAVLDRYEKHVGRTRFKRVYGEYVALCNELGRLPIARNVFSQRIRAAGWKTVVYDGYLDLRASPKVG